MRAHLHLVTVSWPPPVHALSYKKQRSSFGTCIDCGIFSSLKLVVSLSEKLSVRLATFYSNLRLEQYRFYCLLFLSTRQMHKGSGEMLALGST